MKPFNPISMNEYAAKIFAAFFGWIAGLATLAHIKLPFLTWSWLPTMHVSDFVILLIGCLKAGLTGASSWAAVTGMQHSRRWLRKKWNHFKSKK